MLILPLPSNEQLASRLAAATGAEIGVLETRRFPDGESYVRLRSDVSGHEAAFVCTLARPDEQFLSLVFAARAARGAGATKLTLVAPYLGYMRQDKAFKDGEAVTSITFASLISREFDRLITVDPHLHRHKSLNEIYGIPADALHAAPLLSTWIRSNVAEPLIIGPDSESEQWALAIAAGGPVAVLRKERRGDREVDVSFPDLTPWAGRQPVLVDDIASSGRTLVEACKGLTAQGFPKPICVIVHGIFAEDAFEHLTSVADRIVSTDSVPHASNVIALAPLLAKALG